MKKSENRRPQRGTGGARRQGQRQNEKRFPDVEILTDDGIEVSEELKAAGMARGEELREQFAAAHQDHRDESDALIELHPSLKNMRLTCMYDQGCRTVDKPVTASLRQTERFWTIIQEQGVRVKVNNLTRAAMYVWSDAAIRAFPEIRLWGEQFCARCAGLAWERFLTLPDADMFEGQPIERLSRNMWQTNRGVLAVVYRKIACAIDETLESIEAATLEHFSNEQLNALHFSLRQLGNRPMPVLHKIMGGQSIDEALAEIDQLCAVWMEKGMTVDERSAFLHRLDREVKEPQERIARVCEALHRGPLETDWDVEMFRYLTPPLIEQLRVTLVSKIKEIAMHIDELMIRTGNGEAIGFEAGVERVLELVRISAVEAEDDAVEAVSSTA